MSLRVLDILKVGVGPSSSRAMGPMAAAGRFPERPRAAERPPRAGAPPRLGAELAQALRIERNVLGAIEAASLALRGVGGRPVSLGAGVETLRGPGRDMGRRCGEAAPGGRAAAVPAG